MRAVLGLMMLVAACRSGTGSSGIVATVLMRNQSPYSISGAMDAEPSGLLPSGGAPPHSGDLCFRWTARPGDSVDIAMFSTAPQFATYNGVVQRSGWRHSDSHWLFYATDAFIGMQESSPC